MNGGGINANVAIGTPMCILCQGDKTPRPLPLSWNLLYIPVVLLSAGLVLYLYPSMPDQIPLQANLAGEITHSVRKTPFTAMLPVWIDLFMAFCFAFAHWSINKQKAQ